MRIIFCDDDNEILEKLQKYITEFFATFGNCHPEYRSYASGDALLIGEATEKPADIAFLDVEMPGTSGIYAGVTLKKRNPRVKIFVVTAYPDYLDEAMRFKVFRYLSKPIDKARLFRNMKDALYQYNMESKRRYPIETSDGVVTVRADDIVYVATVERKVLVYTINETYVSTKTMDYWKETLILPCFYIPHRSYLINMRYISAIYKDSIRLTYDGTEKEVYLTRRKYAECKDAYLLYMAGG